MTKKAESLKDFMHESAPIKAESAVQKVEKDEEDIVAFGKNKSKKMISAYVSIDRHEQFSAINKARGISNNAQLNLMISDYVLRNKNLI